MGLFSSLKREPGGETQPADPTDDVQLLRLRARRRLVGAAVLVAIGVVGFPLVFETQPRPIPVDLPIEIPRKETAAPLVVPVPGPAELAQPPVAAPPLPQAASVPAQALPALLPVAAPMASEPASARVAAAAASRPVERLVDRSAERAGDKSADKAADKAADKNAAATANDAARAKALLEGREPPQRASEAAAGRFIVQVGAFGEAKAAQEMRNRVEKLGLKTYAQEVQTAEGKRIRVRLGPFGSRDEAEKATAKLRAAGLGGSILTL